MEYSPQSESLGDPGLVHGKEKLKFKAEMPSFSL